MRHLLPWINVCAGLVAAPLLLGVINRTKAVFAGRAGVPLLQLYFDLAKLLRKGTVYSRTTTWVFHAAPVIGLAALVTGLMILPVGSVPAPLSFDGDLLLLAYLLGLLRFFTVLAALDTGSSFEGMGASREVFFAALAEPALIVALAALARQVGSVSLSGIFGGLAGSLRPEVMPALVLVAAALLIVFLAENARIPVDDPNTHLELTMIHEVMVLDYSGPDLAFILYGVALKLWLIGMLLANLLIPLTGLSAGAGLAVVLAGMILLVIVVGIIESVMARLRLLKVPQLLIGAIATAVLAFALVWRAA